MSTEIESGHMPADHGVLAEAAGAWPIDDTVDQTR